MSLFGELLNVESDLARRLDLECPRQAKTAPGPRRTGMDCSQRIALYPASILNSMIVGSRWVLVPAEGMLSSLRIFESRR
jgi:hypothetical protein